MKAGKHHIVFLLTAILFLASGVSDAQSQYRFQHLHRTDGLANEFVSAIAQDTLGYIWFHWADAISRYDGYNFKVYKHNAEDSLRKSLDFFIGDPDMVDHNNQLWLTEHHPSEVGPLFKCARFDWKTDSFIKYEIDIQKVRGLGLALDKSDSIIWIGSIGKGLFKYNINNHKSTSMNSGTDENQKAPLFIGWLKDFGSSILMTTNKGLWLFEKETKKFSQPPCLPRDTAMLWSQDITAINNPNPGDHALWFLVGRKVIVLDKSYTIVKSIVLPQMRFRSLPVFDREGVCWLAGPWSRKEGLYRYDYRDSSLLQFKHDPADPYSLTSDHVNDIMVDADQNVWIATDNGINVLKKHDLVFYNRKISNAAIWTSLIYKAQGKESLLVNCEETPMNYYMVMPVNSSDMASMFFYEPFGKSERAISLGGYKGNNYYWSATLGDGVLGYPIDARTGMFAPEPFITITHDPKSAKTIPSDRTSKAWEDALGNLWVGNQSSDGVDVVRLDVPYGSEESVKHFKIGGGLSDYFLYDDKNSFFVKGNFDLNLVHIPATRDGEYWIESVYESKEILNVVFKSSDGTLFLSTRTKLFSAVKIDGQYKFNAVPLFEGIEVGAMQEDSLGRLWMYGDAQVVCFNRMDTTYTIFDERDGIDHFKAIEIGWFHKTSSGMFITVDPDGVTLFDPNSFKISQRKASPVFTRLEVNNKTFIGRYAPEDPNFKIDSDVVIADQLTLDYLHNNFTLEFSAMEMTAPEKNLYRHKLEGYDPNWIETNHKNRTATYTNLPAGTYTFRVRASNHQGLWSDQERTLKIIILPPPWRTWWAYAGYSLIVIGIIVWARNNLVQRERLKSNLALSKVEQEKEHFELEKAKEVDKIKTSFFTNISHEFRTPLTLIKGPVQNIIDQFVNGQKEIDRHRIVDQLKLVHRNSDHLLKLINQLLDLAKLESGTLKVEKSEGELFSFIRAVASSFESFARQKNISVLIEVPSENCNTPFDKDKLETILINLINNAIKFTPPGGTVSVTAKVANEQLITNNQQLTLCVKDTGIGIPLDQQTKIFERFHQVSEAHKEVGTGIGLALVKELIELMEGKIEVKSEVGKGSEFKIVLPIEIIKTVASYQSPVIGSHEPETGNWNPVTKSKAQEDGETTKPHVLVVEDNTDLRAFIIDSLGNEFYFLEAENGVQGLDKATTEIPDLIISDVMMPEMDGITMAGKIKKDIRTSHIPLILLTAKSTEDSKLSGLQSGADDYLTKPFNKNELLLKVRNGVTRQLKLREKLRAELMSTAPKVEVLSEDERFLNTVKEKILERLSDEQLSVESLAEDIGMSRVQLYRKVSALTDLSVNELIRKLRLQKASQLLQQNWGPVSQVAYEVGFSNLSYFSKVFKEEFGVLPSEYAVKT